MRYSIRALELRDCEHIGPFMRSVWLHAYKNIQTDEEMLAQSHKVHTPAFIRQEIDDAAMFSIVAEVGDKLIGHARGDLEDGYVEVSRLYLMKEYYGLGIGKALLEAVENHFTGVSEIRLDVFEDNKRALSFYLSQGYEIVERSSEIQSQGVDVFDFKMRKFVTR